MTLIGQPINRVDGALKVTGKATYAYEHWDAGQPLYGFIVGATIGHGRIARIDTSRAEQSPGVHLVPVHADIPDLDAVVLDGFDGKANLLGVKGLGELGICGAGAAVANAVFNATGVRVRDFPITLEKVLPGLPQVQV